MTLRWVRSGVALVGGFALVGGALWVASAQNDSGNSANVTDVTSNAPEADPVEAHATPMAQRIATIALLNKRNSQVREFQMKPGDALKVADDLVVRLRACDTTAPWEPDPWTGAFVQVDFQDANKKWGRIFSGWLYKEQPSLNMVQHPIYDVWVKACKMSHGEPADELTLVNGASATNASAQDSSAKKSAAGVAVPTPPKPKPAAPAAPTSPPAPDQPTQDSTAADNSAQ